MKLEKLNNIYYRLCSMTALRDFLDEPISDAFKNIFMWRSNRSMELELGIMEVELDDEPGTLEKGWKLDAYGNLVRCIYEGGGDLGILIRDWLTGKEDFYIKKHIEGEVDETLENALFYDLETLQIFSKITSEDIKSALFPKPDANDEKLLAELPAWNNTKINLKKDFEKILNNLDTKGYGIFAQSIMFKVRNGELIPVQGADYQSLDNLYCYDRERTLVLKNTEALAEGKAASNVLLYGDAGTGKSTTVKACAAHYSNKGVRLIEFDKNQVGEIPVIVDELRHSPLKFIIFIDDLTFTDNDDDYYALKGILEGNVSAAAPNILIYATSNRRHLVKESMADREGDDIHLNDTLQETMSLSARFGLTVTFSKPEKDTYLSIVESLAKEQGLLNPKAKDYEAKKEEILSGAEAFAIRANGRSPRTAKQYIILAKNGLR